MKKSLEELCTAIAICFCTTGNLFTADNQINTDHTIDKNLNLIKEWNEVFPRSNRVSHSKVTFRNHYGITPAADMYRLKHVDGKLLAIAISGPFGAVKEQSLGLCVQKLAECGFLTIAFDPPCTGKSDGEPRYVASPDVNAEDFCAAVDFLSTRDDMDVEHTGIPDVCGWGGMVLNAATTDTCIKATVAPTIYNMSRVSANGYFDAMDADARYELHKQLSEQCIVDTKNGSYALAGGLPDTSPDDAPRSLKDYHAYYKTKHGCHKRPPNSNGGWDKTSALSFINMPIPSYSDEIRSTILIIHGEKAHLRYFSEDVLKKLRDDSKKSLIIPGTNHVDLHDQMSVISFSKIERFFVENLK